MIKYSKKLTVWILGELVRIGTIINKSLTLMARKRSMRSLLLMLLGLKRFLRSQEEAMEVMAGGSLKMARWMLE